MGGRPGRTRLGVRLILWTVTAAAFVALGSIMDCRFRDADSQLYSALGQDLAAKPLAPWFAPQRNGHWNKQGPTGPLTLTRQGVTAWQDQRLQDCPAR